MLTEISPEAGIDELAHIVDSVFGTMLTLETALATAELPRRTDLLTAAVYLTGAHKGAVLIHCLPLQACGFTGRFLGTAAPFAVDDDVRDVMGELANMVAGNLKCTLMPGTQLSMPSVVQGLLGTLRICGGVNPIRQTAFTTELGPLWISLVTSIDD